MLEVSPSFLLFQNQISYVILKKVFLKVLKKKEKRCECIISRCFINDTVLYDSRTSGTRLSVLTLVDYDKCAIYFYVFYFEKKYARDFITFNVVTIEFKYWISCNVQKTVIRVQMTFIIIILTTLYVEKLKSIKSAAPVETVPISAKNSHSLA